MNHSIKILLRRVLNWLNPRGPKLLINSLDDLPIYSKSSDLERSSFFNKIVAPRVSVDLDVTKIKPLTDEDYILNCDLENHTTVVFKERHLMQFKNCRVLPPEGDLITEEGELLAFLTPNNQNTIYHNGLLKTRYNKPKRLRGHSLNLIKPHASNYYHWIYEALPNVRHTNGLSLPIDNYLVPKKSPFVTSSLIKLGVNPDSIIEVSEEILLCDSVYTATTQIEMLPNPSDILWISEHFRHRPDQEGLKLYISRKDAGWRSIQNECEVNTLLNEFGFQSLILSEMTVEEQLKAFANASCVISCHGAGLTNLAFCKKGVKILEIFPPRWTPLCYAAVAQYIGADYHYCNADPLGLSESEIKLNRNHVPLDSSPQGETLTIPIDKLTQFCELL